MSLEKLILPVILVQLFQSLLASAMGGPLYRQIVASLVKKFVFQSFEIVDRNLANTKVLAK